MMSDDEVEAAVDASIWAPDYGALPVPVGETGAGQPELPY
jgi:hypothetical protein